MGFEQATIGVVREREFGELKAAIERVLAPGRVVKFLKVLGGCRIQIRDLEGVLAAGVIDRVESDHGAAARAETAASLYGSLPVSDQAQIREFYLSRIEEVEPRLRAKFQKLYQDS